MKVLKVLIDAGHGVNTKGKRSPVWPNGMQLLEWQYNRTLSRKLYAKCAQHPELMPILLVTEDKDIGLSARARRANAYGSKASIFISMHGNAATNSSARGWEVHTSEGFTKADLLADCLWQNVKEDMPAMKMRHDLSDKDHDFESKFTVLVKTTMPAVLVENGFFTNFEECMNMLNDEWQDKLVDALVAGILDYYHNHYA